MREREAGQSVWKQIHLTPVRALVICASLIFIAEMFVMFVFFFFPVVFSPAETAVTRSILDATFLVILLVPMLYFFIYRPLHIVIRERMKAEDALREETEKEERYLDIAGVMLVALDTSGRVTLINRKGCEILGCAGEDVVGKDWFECFVPERIRADKRQVFSRLVMGSAPFDEFYEDFIRRKDGVEKIIRWHRRLLVEDGRSVGTLSSGEDVTERRATLTALAESEVRYRLVHNSAFDAIIISDARDNVMECNPSAEKVFGYEPGSLVGTPLTGLMPEPYRERHSKALARFLETGVSTVQGRVLELEGLRRNGEVFPIELILSRFTLGGQVYFTGTIRDITERRHAERERVAMQSKLAQSQKMEAIGRLAGGIAHDFNNILTAIRGNAELAMDDLGPDSPVRERFDEIIQSILTASKLTRQLLLFSRGQSREVALLDINQTIENLLNLIRRLIGDDITVETVFDPALWTVRADEGTIEQVVMNLAVNARDAMPDGGTLDITTGNVTIGDTEAASMPEARPGRFVRVIVKDTGMGMDSLLQEHIFEPFFTTKEPGKGTGLGLSVVYGIVKRQGGWITVSSSSASGTVFDIYLPAFVSEEGLKVRDEEADYVWRGKGERILFVDIDPMVRQMTRKALSDRGYVVFDAEDEKTALDIFEREGGRFQLLLSDVVLPGSSVLKLVDGLLGRSPGLRILLTGTFMEIKSKRLALSETGFRYLQKPYSLNGLLRAVAGSIEHTKGKGKA
ncbi:MAG: PAS domain S-box protein [Deltaproteobacteria bacterium]|nr:PAS domain S-box protein [Deltaproteobacteria bacterium]